MKSKTAYSLDTDLEAADVRRSLFEPEDTDEADLWFLPQSDGEGLDVSAIPLPKSDARALFDPAEWGRAQAELSGPLATLAMRIGVLHERLRAMGQGPRHRLAIREAADLSWWTGGRIGAERLTLWAGQRAGGGLDDSLALMQAGWAVRRLSAGQRPNSGGWVAGLAAFLGTGQTTGSPASATFQDLADVMAAMQDLHPVTQSAVLFHAARIAGNGPARDMEAAVMAACHGASMVGATDAGLSFLPLAMSGVGALSGTGTARQRLAAWIEGADRAALSASAQLAQLAAWRAKAQAALADLSGRTPGLLVDLLSAWPMVSAPMVEAQAGVSRAAAQRNLEIIQTRGLSREMTGQGRYRVWVARV